MSFKIFILAIFILGSCSSGNRKVPKDGETQETIVHSNELSLDKEDLSKEGSESIIDLSKHGISKNPNNILGGLKEGDLAPDFELEDQNGNLISLYESLKKGPVLLVFYRADWCSICRRHLAEFEQNINDLGSGSLVNVLAISPQMQKYSLKLHSDNNYSFPILYDKDHQTMKDYKVFFHVTEKYNQYITVEKGDPIEVRNGNTEPVMPVPATYLIDRNKRIKYVHYDPNYRVRADINEALKALLE